MVRLVAGHLPIRDAPPACDGFINEASHVATNAQNRVNADYYTIPLKTAIKQPSDRPRFLLISVGGIPLSRSVESGIVQRNHTTKHFSSTSMSCRRGGSALAAYRRQNRQKDSQLCRTCCVGVYFSLVRLSIVVSLRSRFVIGQPASIAGQKQD